LTYEGYGPGGTAVIVRAMTDNRNRTAGEIRHIFSKNGGNMGESGCVSWRFKEKGVLTVERESCKLGADDLMLMALELGAEDIEEDEDVLEIITAPEAFQAVKEGLEKEGVVFSDGEITMLSDNDVVVTDLDQAKYVLRMMDALDEHDDVQNTYTNFDVPDEIADQLG
ncbi:MAG: YebC/PmpR family DNA-binding transcriptional regulator, partial [Clostridiales bacterium]|nr:YebC/PmpR family DNA-binding transcriptional regulator [Clostridiales bacterium]